MKPLLSACLLSACLASTIGNAAPPAWWSTGNPPVINPNAPSNNKGPASIGQAKWMAKNALDALRAVNDATADAVEADLVGAGKPIPNWNPPATPQEKASQRSPLLIGQLKAISAPFYQHLHDLNSTWLENERNLNGTSISGTHFPWTPETTDDANRAIATIGQLKAVFSLRFDEQMLGDNRRLLAHWKMNEGKGNHVGDSGSGSHHGVRQGAGLWREGFNGMGGMSFDGVNDHVSVSSSPQGELDIGIRSFSIAFWFKTQASTPQRILGKGNGYWLAINNQGAGKISLGIDSANSMSGAAIIGTASGLNDGQWHHVVGIRDQEDKRVRLFVDGVPQALEIVPGYGGQLVDGGAALDSTMLTSGQASSSDPLLIAQAPGNSERFAGELDEVRIYDEALSAARIANIFNFDELRNGTPDRMESPSGPMVDSDGDGMSDLWEIEHSLNPHDNGEFQSLNGANGDPDGDGLINADECAYGTDPHDADSDDDYVSDGVEVNSN